MKPATTTFAIGRFRLALAVDPKGCVREEWSPRPPVRLSPPELAIYRRVIAGFRAPVVLDAIPAGTPTRRNISGKVVAVAEASR